MKETELINLLKFSAEDDTYKDLKVLIIDEELISSDIMRTFLEIEQKYKIDNSDILSYKSRFNSIMEYKQYVRNINISNILKLK
jgi:hypothetical protein